MRVATEVYLADPDPRRLSAITREIVELDGLVDEILLASRLDHQAEPDADESVDCLALAAEEAARAGVALAEVNEAGPFVVQGSTRLLRRLIRNLIDNALKHGARPVEVALRRGPDDLEICVSDHGSGVAEDLREHVFAPFFRPGGQGEGARQLGVGPLPGAADRRASRRGGDVSARR